MSAKYSGRIHDPNHTAADYDIYFNETLIQTGTDYGSDYIGMITRQGSSVRIPDGVTEIGVSAFRGMTNLRDVYIPDGLTSIRGNSFYGAGIEDIYLPSSVQSIPNNAFASTPENIIIRCGFSEGSVAGAPWGAPASATVLYDQERPEGL